MKHLLAKALRRAANRLDPPPKPPLIHGNTIYGNTFTSSSAYGVTIQGSK